MDSSFLLVLFFNFSFSYSQYPPQTLVSSYLFILLPSILLLTPARSCCTRFVEVL
jgi:hypothetical protein